MIYTQAAELIISSDSRYHSYAFKSRHSIFNRYLKKVSSVFLQHGVISFKRVPSFTKGMKLGCDLFVVSTDRERQIVIDNLGYDPEQVINTGLPRWDVLEDKSQGSREVLIMPTWRYSMEIISDNDFEQSLYFRSYMALLNSPRFADILEKYDLQVLRFFMLNAHYRSPLNFSADLMEAAKNALERITDAAANLKDRKAAAQTETATDAEKELLAQAQEFVKKFEEAMDDDFNTADALAAIFELVKFANTNVSEASSAEFAGALLDTMVKLCDVLGLKAVKTEEILDKEIEDLIAERQEARKAKNFARADEIRDELLAKGIILKDTREGVKWKRA